MLTIIDLLEFSPVVNFLTNDNPCCCFTKETKTESAHHKRRIYGSRPAGRDAAIVESTDARRNVLSCPHQERKIPGSNPACDGIFPGRVIPVT